MAVLTPMVIKLGNVQWYYVRFYTQNYIPSQSKNLENMGKISSHRSRDFAFYGMQLVCCDETKETHRMTVICCVKREFANIEE